MAQGWIQIAAFLILLTALVPLVGGYIARVFQGEAVFLSRVLGPVERFAYRALRTKLTCTELGLAVDEVRWASKSLGRPVQGMSASDLSRTRALSVQVESELSRERAGRCRT